MAAYIQVLLPLLCVFLTHGKDVPKKIDEWTNQPNNVYVHTLFSPLSPELPSIPHREGRPINGDIFSYNDQHSYDDYYHDSNYSPHSEPGYSYFGYPNQNGVTDFDNMPFGYPDIHNGYNNPNGQGYPENNNNNQPQNKNPNEIQRNKGQPGDKKNDDHSEKPKKDNQKPDDKESKPDNTHIEKNKQDVKKNKNKDKVHLKPNKDFLLVGSDGKDVYLLHENTPNTNPITLPNVNQPAGSNVVYMPYNPPQPGGQVYQLVTGQPSVSTNLPITPNRLNLNAYNNAKPSQGLPIQVLPSSSNKPSSVYIYANGQLIQIPGVIVNPQQSPVPLQNGNAVPGVSAPNVVYVSQPAQGNNPVVLQVPNGSPVSHGVSGVVIQNPPVANGNMLPNNNYVVSQPIASQPSGPVANGYPQTNGVYNIVNPGTVVNSNPRPNPIYYVLSPGPQANGNPQANGMNNFVNPGSVANGNSQPNVVYAVANPAPVANGNQQTNGINNVVNPGSIASGNPQPNGIYNVANPGSVANGNSQTNGYIQQNPSAAANNPPNGNTQSNGMYNGANPGAASSIQPSPVVAVNSNQPVQPAYALPPTQNKELNTGALTPNNVPATAMPQASPVTEAPKPNNNDNLNILGAQPAVMVSGFKESEGGTKDDKKAAKGAKAINQTKDEKKKA